MEEQRVGRNHCFSFYPHYHRTSTYFGVAMFLKLEVLSANVKYISGQVWNTPMKNFFKLCPIPNFLNYVQ